MKYGIISDIHANLEAFEEVLSFLEDKVDKIICLGDIIGYNANPNECVEIVKMNKFPTVAGNHEYMVENILDSNAMGINPIAQASMEWTKKILKPENLKFIESIPPRLELPDFQIAHGSVRDPILEYVTNIEIAEPSFKLMKKALCFIGHTHRPSLMYQNGGKLNGLSVKGDAVFSIKDNKKTIFNVGSVGQPRDGDPRAACVIYNSDKKEIEIFRISYDIEKTQDKMRKAGLPQRLIDRLKTGT